MRVGAPVGIGTRALIPLLVTVLALVLAPSSSAATTVVHPTGQFPTDVGNVQAAVDQGDTVQLKATDPAGNPTAFNFGAAVPGSGFVTLTRDVEVIGERQGSAETTVRGGDAPFRSRSATTTVIRGIAFEGPLFGALFFLGPSSADTEIVGNRISGVVGEQFASRQFAEAILVSGGRVVIADNTVEDVRSQAAIGISQFRSAGPVKIVRNHVSGTNTIGIESTANQSSVRIEDNVVLPGPERDPFGSAGTGIEINGTGAYRVARNDVVIENPNGTPLLAWGTTRFGFGPVTAPAIEMNRFTLHAGAGPVLIGQVFDGYLGQNLIRGTGFNAFLLLDFDGVGPAFNTLVGNNIAGFESEDVDVFLDEHTHDNVLKGYSGTVLDLGTNNHISGFTKRGGSGSGRQVSEALKRRATSYPPASAPHPEPPS